MKQIFIKAINPGYTVDEEKNVGEFIELGRTDVNNTEPISLAGIVISYTNSSGNITNLLEFPENSWLTGETLLLRLASSKDAELSNLQYFKTLAMKAGPLLLTGQDGEVIDSVCWTGADGCYETFDGAKPSSLVYDGELVLYEQVQQYEPSFNPESYYIEAGYGEEEALISRCHSLVFSEILSYYESEQSEQFIELYNPTGEQVLLNGCQLKYKNKYYPLSGIVPADGYFVRLATDFALTKNPTSQNTIELIDVNGELVDSVTYYNGQKKATSYANIGTNEAGGSIWRNTYAPTPGGANSYQEYRACEEGKVINEDTGNCVKKVEEVVTVCPAGKYLNPATGRCKTIETETEKTCEEGYELNPDTNRCRKIKENTGADYALNTNANPTTSNFIALYAIAIIVLVGLIYVVYQYRYEIKKLISKFFKR